TLRPAPATSLLPTDPATPQIYPLSLHDALPIFSGVAEHQTLVTSAQFLFTVFVDAGGNIHRLFADAVQHCAAGAVKTDIGAVVRSEEHTSELQSRFDLVCRLLLEKKK